MKHQLIAAAAAALLAAPALAADPTASLNRSWTEYAGTGAIGNNNINNNSTAYWFYESSGTWMGQAVNSWFVFWDPKASLDLKGTISFDNNILFVHDEKSELTATAGFNKTGVTYDYSNALVGLEAADRSNTSFAGNTLTLKWQASNPGDHIRVMTAVPEPSTYLMAASGLLVLGAIARRRRSN